MGARGFELPEVVHLHAALDARERHVLALRLRCLEVAAHGDAEGRAGEQSVRRNTAARTEVRAVDVDVCSLRSELKFARAALEGDRTERRTNVALRGQINRVCAVKRRSGALRTNVAARIQADVPPCAVIELPRWIDRFEVMSTVFEPLRKPTETSLSAFTV